MTEKDEKMTPLGWLGMFILWAWITALLYVTVTAGELHVFGTPMLIGGFIMFGRMLIKAAIEKLSG